MRYSKWIEDNLPMYKGATTAETYALIHRARKSSLAWTVSAKAAMVAIALGLMNYLGPAYGIAPFQGLSGWTAAAFSLSIALLVSHRIEYAILTHRLKRLARDA